jgi:hypothetical protein
MSNLFINRFIVVSKGKTVYNESFHKGLNIIRGQNGSGKSTIIELIYYVLGADHIDWKEEALKCDYVIAEIEINNHTLSIKREIKTDSIPPLYVFWGKLEDTTITSWEVYSMRRSNERESFSQIVFRALNIPDSSENTSLTMHQILRVLYIDQLSSVSLLMRPEPFDPSTIREAVSKTLMGAYDIQLLADENKLRKMKSDMEKYESEIKNISYIIKENNFNLSINDVRKKINENIERIKKIDISITNFNQEKIKQTVTKNDTKINDLFKHMKKTKEKYIMLTENINSITYDIIDSENFIKELNQRIIDINNSISIRKFLPTLHISFCPICLNLIDNAHEENICPLCKKNISENDLTSNALRLKNEIGFQLKESIIVIENKKQTLDKLKIETLTISKQISLLQTEIDSYSITIETTEQKERDELLFIKGNLSKEIEYLNKEMTFQERLKEDIRILENLKTEISDLEIQINIKRGRLNKNYNDAMNLIKKNTIEFIKKDLTRDLPMDDYSLSGLNIDFDKYNTFSINNKYNYAASSMAYLKNSIMFAFFFASLELNSMNYPRFIMCDNTEDKGMEEARSRNFQLRLYEKSQQYNQADHQIIITTSMIDPSLDKPEICIGEYYTNESKSLKFNI